MGSFILGGPPWTAHEKARLLRGSKTAGLKIARRAGISLVAVSAFCRSRESGDFLALTTGAARGVGRANCELSRFDVLSARAFRSLGFLEGYGLTFIEIFKGNALNAFRVKEKVFAASDLNESEAFIRQLLNRALSHLRELLGWG